jgi:dTDP-4-dehydrorhamnose reductase
MSHRDSKNAVIFGSAGQLGVELMRVFRERGYELQGYDRDVIDICDAAAVEAVLARADPALVVNAAAYNMVDIAEHEPAAAFQANALAVRNLAIACRQVDAQLVHYSTDYVFDGTAGRPYTEQDKPHPLGAYAVSKYAGELYAEAYLDRPLIIRTSGVFGPGGLHTARGNFIELMLRLARGSQPIRVVEDHVASPAYAPALAERTAQLVERDATGVFHVGGGVPISWFEFARMIFRLGGVSPELKPTSEREYRTEAKRPKFSALSNSKMEAFGIAPMPSMEEAVADYFERRKEQVAGKSVS